MSYEETIPDEYVLKDLSHIDNFELASEEDKQTIDTFLGVVRESGATNMVGASHYLRVHFKMQSRPAMDANKWWLDKPYREAALKRRLTGG